MTATLIAERPKRKLSVLHNGVKVATWEDKSFGHNVFFGISLPFGANIEPVMKEGLGHYTEHALVSKAVVTAISNTGGDFNARTEVQSTEFYGATLADKFGGIFWQYAQMLKQPNFGPVHLAHEKKRVLAEIKEYPRLSQSLILQLAILGDHPDRKNVLGVPAVVEHLSVDDVKAHWKKLLQPQHMTIAISGDICHEAAVALVDNCFGNMPVGQSPVIAPAGFTPHIHYASADAGTSRTRVTAMFKSLAHEHKMSEHIPLLVHFLTDQQDLSLEYDLTHRRGLVYSSWAECSRTNAYQTVDLGCEFDAPAAHEIANSIFESTYGMVDRITEDHMRHAEVRMQFLAGCEAHSLSLYRNQLLETAPEGKLPRTRLEAFMETKVPTLAQAKDLAAMTFRDTPPAIAVSGAGAIPIIKRLRPVAA